MLHPESILRPTLLALALASIFALAPRTGAANPTGATVIQGQASFSNPQPNTLLVTTQNGAGTQHSAINWQSFSIPAGNTTRFLQPDANSTSINRVVTNTPTLLFGQLSSNGKLVLVNQAGIAVGSGAVVDTAGFTASTVGMSELDAIAGRLRFGGSGLTETVGTVGALSVQGNIVARGGDVVLIAPNVEVARSALVESQGGSVTLAAGQSVEVTGRGLEGITLQVQAPADKAVNLGTLKGDAVGIFAGQLRHSGLIQASQANLEGGRVVLRAAGHAWVEGDGRIEASGVRGGEVDVLGQRVVLADRAALDVSGAQGGGTIRVGGDYQGSNASVPNSQVTYGGSAVRLNADATQSGPGGKVIVWADDTTRFFGGVSARGGALGGDGGFVEVSGKKYLDFRGNVDTLAPRGRTGELLLDPFELRIDSAGDSGLLSGPPIVETTGGASILNVGTLTGALVSTNVSVNASGGDHYIVVATPVTWASSQELSLKTGAPGWIDVQAAITATGGTLKLDAGTAGISQTASGIISVSKLKVLSTGPVSLTQANDVGTLAGVVSGSGFTFNNISDLTVDTIGPTSGLTVSGGNIALQAGGLNKTLTISQPVQATTGSVSYVADNQVHTAATTTSAVAGNFVEIKPATAATAIEFSPAGDSPGTLRLSASELAFTTPLLKVGNNANTGGIQISEAVAPVNFSSMSLITGGGSISQSAGSTVAITSLNADGANGVALPESNSVTNLAGHVGPSASVRSFSFNNVGSINLATVDVISGINNDGGVGSSISLTAGGSVMQGVGAPINAPTSALSVAASSGINLSLVGVNTPVGVNFTTTGGNVAYEGQTPALTITGASASSGSIKIRSSGGIDIPMSTIISAMAPGDAVVLGATAGPFIMDPASGISTPSGRYLLYLDDPAGGHSYGPLTMTATDFKQYAAPWATLPAQPVGNGRMFGVTPSLTSSLVGSATKVYDGNTSIALTASNYGAPAGHIDGDIGGSVTGSVGVLASPNVGSGIMVNSSSALVSGVKDATNNYPVYGYGVAGASGAIGQVTPLAVSTTVNLTGSRVYDGTNIVNWDIFNIGGLVRGETLTLSGAGTVPDKNVGINKPVSLGSLTLGDGTGLASNYTFAGGLHIANITPLTLSSVTGISATSKVYDGSPLASLSLGSATLSGMIGSDAVLLTGGTGAFDDKNVGVAKKVRVTGLTLGGADAGNYLLATDRIGGVTADINPALITGISGLSVANKVYDGSTTATLNATTAVFSGQVAGDTLMLPSASAAFLDKQAGTAKAVTINGLALGGADAGNYRYTGASSTLVSADISRAPISVTGGISASSKVYDGNTNAQVRLVDPTLAGKLAGDDLGLSVAAGSFADKNVGAGKIVTLAGLSFTGADAANYMLASGAPITTTADITKAVLTGLSGITAAKKVYDGNTDATLDLGLAWFTGQVPGDNLVVTAARGAFVDKNAGQGKLVNITGIAIAGTDLGNYSLGDISSARTTADIDRRPLTDVLGITASNKVYDGKTDAVMVLGAVSFGGKLAGDELVVTGASGQFADRHVGASKLVTISDLRLSGADAANYTLAGGASPTRADITVRPSATWTGSVDNRWGNAGNWDALPDGSNVLAVTIGGTSGQVVYDAAVGTTSLQSVASSLPLSVTGGALIVSDSVSTSGLDQTAGSLGGAGSLRVSGTFNQTGGSVAMGAIDITQPTGNIMVRDLSGASVKMEAQGGAIQQTGPLSTAQLKTSSTAGTVLTDPGNRVGSFQGFNGGAGDIALVNSGKLTVNSIVNGGGSVSVINTGALVTEGVVIASRGTANLVSNSPLTIGTGGVSASGDVVLTASNLTSPGDLTLEGDVVSRGGVVVLNAGRDLIQNRRVSGVNGVTADVGRSLILGPLASTSFPPVTYRVAGVQVEPPHELDAVRQPGTLVLAFLERFDRAVASHHRGGDELGLDPRRRRDDRQDDVVVEDQSCRR